MAVCDTMLYKSIRAVFHVHGSTVPLHRKSRNLPCISAPKRHSVNGQTMPENLAGTEQILRKNVMRFLGLYAT